ncbi:hypothetical protein M8J77_019999 [Diaphorina citri]|nr:hypothetical protein M8J77_019999 [Diaphorina citri]
MSCQPPIAHNSSQNVPSGPKIWNYERANWELYQSKINLDFVDDISEDNPSLSDIDQLLSRINANMLSAAADSIPLKKIPSDKLPVPWWDDEIKEVIKNRRKTLRTLRRNPTIDNKIAFMKARAIARKTMKEKKRASWTQFVASIDHSVSSSEMFHRMGKLRGKYKPRHIPALQNPSCPTQLDYDSVTIANTLAKQFSDVSADENYSPDFLRHKALCESIPIDFDLNSDADYNRKFTTNELNNSLISCVSKAAGPDGISFIFIKKLPTVALEKLLLFFNLVWCKGVYPSEWSKSLIIPLLKPDYGCIVYASAKESNLRKLNTVHHSGIRIAIGALRTSPIPSLYVESGIPSLKLRRDKLTMNYIAKVGGSPFNPVHGSKSATSTSCAFSVDGILSANMLNSINSIFSAELIAILLCLRSIINHPAMRFLIVSDSMGSLSAIANPYFSCPIISQIYSAWSDLKAVGKYVKLLWCPSHCGISGNEAVDQAAKDPLSIIPRDHGNVAHLNICTPQDFKPWIAKLIKTQWQRSWDDIPNNKLKRIKPKIEEWPSSQRSTRMEEVVLTRLRIGHTRLTHKYLFTREPQPVCQCGETLSIQHILVCPTHAHIRSSLPSPPSLSDDVEGVDALFLYFKTLNLFNLM